MKRVHFLTLFIGTHLLFVILHIYKHTQFVAQLYRKQKNEQTYSKLIQQKQTFSHQLAKQKDHAHIKQYAQTKLNMKPIRLHQIRKLSHDKQNT